MSKRRKRLLIYGVPLVVLLGLGVFVKVKVDRIEAGARRLAELGQTAQKVLGEYRAGVEKLDAALVAAAFDDDYSNGAEGPLVEELRSERDGVRVYEWRAGGPRPFSKRDAAEQVARYLATISSIEEAKFKLDAVEQIVGPEEMVIRSFLWLRGSRPAQAVEVIASEGARPTETEAFETQVLFRMCLRARDGRWKIAWQELIHGTTITGDRRGFVDVTEAAGLDFVARPNPLWATPEWRPAKTEFVKYGSGGVAAADYDSDGWYDIFFADGERPRLYRNRGGGLFEDATARAGLPEVMIGAHTGILADFDNDGHKDLFVGTTTGPNRIFRNRGDATFEDVTAGAGLGGEMVTVASAADYDSDGDLDIYVGRYLDPRRSVPTTLFYARNGVGNSLLRNDGGFRFTDVTESAGVREGGLTLGVAWGDYDGDGRPDMYITNDFGRNALLRNLGDGRFADVSHETGTLDFGYGMSSTFADVDNDGDLDIYVSNVHSGQRWYAQAVTLHKYMLNSMRQGTFFEDFPTYREIYRYVGADYRGYGDRMVKGNSLLINDGAGRFKDVAEAARANPFGWYWGSTVFDYDNDGRQDIYAVNGWITSKTTADL